MAIRKIARMGHPILAVKAKTVDNPTAPEIRYLIQEMLDTMQDAQGAGLSAPQVYESKRLVIFHAPEECAVPENEEGNAGHHSAPLTILINPEIEILSQEMEDGWEGCLSVPGMRGLVPRYRRIRYSGVDHEGRLVEHEAEGFHARVAQHECDHLDGILYPQRMTDLSRLIFDTEAQHWISSKAEGSEELEEG